MAASGYQVGTMTRGHREVPVRGEVGKIRGVTGIQGSVPTDGLVVSGKVDDAKAVAVVEEAGQTAGRF